METGCVVITIFYAFVECFNSTTDACETPFGITNDISESARQYDCRRIGGKRQQLLLGDLYQTFSSIRDLPGPAMRGSSSPEGNGTNRRRVVDDVAGSMHCVYARSA